MVSTSRRGDAPHCWAVVSVAPEKKKKLEVRAHDAFSLKKKLTHKPAGFPVGLRPVGFYDDDQ